MYAKPNHEISKIKTLKETVCIHCPAVTLKYGVGHPKNPKRAAVYTLTCSNPKVLREAP